LPCPKCVSEVKKYLGPTEVPSDFVFFFMFIGMNSITDSFLRQYHYLG
jgi:hypothetical protein